MNKPKMILFDYGQTLVAEEPFDGIKGTTAALSNITYAGSVVSERINCLFPDNHFEFILATSEYLFRKPHTRIFCLALEKAGLKPEDAWYVGDNYACDVVGARNTGMFPIWYMGAMDFEQVDHEDVLKNTKLD